jgi:hypothetical protein
VAVRVTQAVEFAEVPTLGTSLVRVSQVCAIFEIPSIPLPFTYPITLPAISGIGPKDFTLSLETVDGEVVSPFTLAEQEQLWPGEMFTAEVNLPPMLYPQAEQWICALAQLYGKYGTFLMGDWNRLTPQGKFNGSPVVNGSVPSGSNELPIRGATASVANWAVAGDYIQVTASGGLQRLYKVLQTAATNSSGDATLAIRPQTREALSDGTAIITSNCAGTFRLMSNKQPWKIDQNRVYSISFKAREAGLL